MTFEEFLIKKKIDPVQLQHADQDFFDEFTSHFEQMGEKSFDHSKKFWFNKLRRAYPLPEKQTEALAPRTEALEVPPKNHETVAEAPEAPSFEAKPAFKPRFKANIAASKEEIKQESQEDPTKSVENQVNTEAPSVKTEAPEDKINEAKPTFKPRFKSSMLKKGSKFD